jgi:cold shock protein
MESGAEGYGMSGVKINGKVKWFNNAKGYGFINAEGKPEEDLFAHYSAITMDGYKTLKAGQAVTFETIQGPKGLHAVAISAAEAQTEALPPEEMHEKKLKTDQLTQSKKKQTA